MPKYYFNIIDYGGVIWDLEGTELPGLHAAREEAQQVARELLAEALRAHKGVENKKIEITDVDGVVLEAFRVRVSLS